MSTKTQLVEVTAQAATMLACAGAVVAAGFSFDNILELRANSSLMHDIDKFNSNIQTRAFATVIMAIISSMVIPLGVIMVIISLFKIDLGICRKLLVATDVVLIVLAIFGYGVAGVLGVFTVKEWSDDIVKTIGTDLVRDIRTDIAATTACSLLACLSCVALLVFIVIEYLRHRKHQSQVRANIKYKNYDSL